MSDVRIDLDRLVELEKNATAIPWYAFDNAKRDLIYKAIEMTGADWQLASALRNAAPAFIRVVKTASLVLRINEPLDPEDGGVTFYEDLSEALAAFKEGKK